MALQDMTTIQLQRDEELIQEALASKLYKSEKMAVLLNRTIEDVEKEIGELERNRKRLLSLIKQTEHKILVNDQRLQTRSQRPPRELVNDDVQAQLASTATLLKSTMDKLHRCVKSTEVDIGRLQESRMALKHDLANKKSAIGVDKEVMKDETGSGLDSRGAIRKVQGRSPLAPSSLRLQRTGSRVFRIYGSQVLEAHGPADVAVLGALGVCSHLESHVPIAAVLHAYSTAAV